MAVFESKSEYFTITIIIDTNPPDLIHYVLYYHQPCFIIHRVQYRFKKLLVYITKIMISIISGLTKTL